MSVRITRPNSDERVVSDTDRHATDFDGTKIDARAGECATGAIGKMARVTPAPPRVRMPDATCLAGG
ncbi:MAG: hypothetical protein H6822_33165 [Planctomycetaceae bacterium]|nr:hypothetical protein [Planctomycetales bacterium]MCB9927037.1 hypothetical protein [Planctomycetaceae bacterium]